MVDFGGLVRAPSLAHRRCGRWLVVPFALVTLASAVSLSRLVVSGELPRGLPRGDPYLSAERVDEQHFIANDFVVISVDIVGGDLVQALVRVDDLSGQLRDVEGVQQVLSVATVADLRVSADEMSFEPMYRPGMTAAQCEALLGTVRRTQVFQEFLVSRDADAFSIYVFTRRGADPALVIPRIEELSARGSGGGVHVLGKRSLQAYICRTVVPDLVLLGSIALAVILAFEVVMTRSILVGAVLWLSTLLPSVWTLGLFPPLGLRLDTETVFIPLVILALSTTYGIHLFRHLAVGGSSGIAEALSEITPVIFAAGFTTILGFLSLMGSPLRGMRAMGGMLMAGIALAVASSLFFLPALFKAVRIPRLVPLRGAAFIAHLSESRTVLPVFLAVMAVLLAGTAFIQNDYRFQRYLSPRTALARTITYFATRYGGVDEVELVVDTGRENGLLAPDVFERIREIRSDLAGFSSVAHVVSYTQFVDWVQERLAGGEAPPVPLTDAAIGESLELLSYGASGWGMGSLVDSAYRRAKLVVRFGASTSSPAAASRALSALLAGIDSSMRRRLPQTGWSVLGEPVASQRRLSYLIRGQLSGIAIYFVLLFFYAALYFRSWRWPLVALLPSLCGVVVYLGIMGWGQIPLSVVTTTCIAAVMGVGVDDVLCLITFFRGRRLRKGTARALEETIQMSGTAIIQTTLIIVLALLALVFSRYRAFIQASLVAGVTFCCCTIATLVVVPWFIRRGRMGSK